MPCSGFAEHSDCCTHFQKVPHRKDFRNKDKPDYPKISWQLSHSANDCDDRTFKRWDLLGVGIFDWLQSNPMADVGLFQAYSLMMLAGIVLWIGSFQENPWTWDLVGLLAHIPPFLASFMFTDVLAEASLPSIIPLHGFFILWELFILLYYCLIPYQLSR